MILTAKEKEKARHGCDFYHHGVCVHKGCLCLSYAREEKLTEPKSITMKYTETKLFKKRAKEYLENDDKLDRVETYKASLRKEIEKRMEEHAQNEVERYKKRWSLAHKALLISMECFKGQATALMPMYELYKARDKAITEYNALLKDDQDEKKMKPNKNIKTMGIAEETLQEIKALRSDIAQLKEASKPTNKRIPLPDFCKQRDISRPTAMAWGEKKLIEIEKIGGRNYVKADSITVVKKWG